MNSRSLKKLEFDKIKEQLKTYLSGAGALELVDNLAPYDNIHDVSEHLKETEEGESILSKKGSPPFSGLYDIKDALSLLKKGGVLRGDSILKIGRTLTIARELKKFIETEDHTYSILEDISINLTPLKGIEDDIYRIIIGEDEIYDKASEKLWSIRRSLKDKNASIKDKVAGILRTFAPYLQENLYTMRGDRYVIPVRAEHKGKVEGLVHDQSSSGATIFIEPMVLVSLNNEIKELKIAEKAEVDRILAELSRTLYNNFDKISLNYSVINELDFIFAKAKFGSEIFGVIPEVSDNGYINIIDGRHPLIDERKVVPISIAFPNDINSVIITGPNTGGKTVSLKTIGLLHIMGLSGLMIPAGSGTCISFLEEVYADIGDEQSIEQSLSTFSSHMTNIVNIIDKADNKSLCLFDELGAGTDPTEGAALAISIINELKMRKAKTIATTHYSELKIYALKTEGVLNAAVEFDVATLRPTYRLEVGIPGKSNAFEISKRLGLPEYIIEESRKIISKDSLEFEDLITSLHEKRKKAEEELREIEALKRDAKDYKKKYEDRWMQLQDIRDKELNEARRQAKLILKEAKAEADNSIKNIRELEKAGISSDSRKKLEEERKRLKDKIDDSDEKSALKNRVRGKKPESIKLGEEFLLTSLNQKVIALSLPNDKGDLEVQAGIMKINVNISDLAKLDIKTETKKSHKRGEVNLNLSSISSSIDLRGLDAEEALYRVDKYLDEAYMAGLTQVTIIHGKGTGILRNAINELLRGYKHVKSFRLGEYGEGGTGVTVAIFK
ncbi:MAG: endonuclease MutS2 [Bacillota bacterium]|nr:endonuclease MutS2 [Bacillota bacterium]